MVSGDGNNIFVLQYPTNLDISQLFRVSGDGRYLIPGTSQVNPMNIHAYWFAEEHQAKDVFGLLDSKNKENDMPTLNRAYLGLSAAMQEGDGRMVVEILETMRRGNVNVKAPDWDEREWTDYLRRRYEDLGLQKMLEFVTKAGVQGSYQATELSEKSNEKTGTYRLEVPFPNDTLPIIYEESKEDGRLLSVMIFNETDATAE